MSMQVGFTETSFLGLVLDEDLLRAEFESIVGAGSTESEERPPTPAGNVAGREAGFESQPATAPLGSQLRCCPGSGNSKAVRAGAVSSVGWPSGGADCYGRTATPLDLLGGNLSRE